jgi:hypothetical protein
MEENEGREENGAERKRIEEIINERKLSLERRLENWNRKDESIL